MYEYVKELINLGLANDANVRRRHGDSLMQYLQDCIELDRDWVVRKTETSGKRIT